MPLCAVAIIIRKLKVLLGYQGISCCLTGSQPLHISFKLVFHECMFLMIVFDFLKIFTFVIVENECDYRIFCAVEKCL